MSRRCDITGVGAQVGHKVSHSNHKTKKKFQPNLQEVSLLSDSLGKTFSLRVTAATLRSVEHNGGLDAYLLNHADAKLAPAALKIKRQLKKAAKAA